MSDLRLNIGSNDRHLDGYRSVDICPPADEIVDLNGPWPWEKSSVLAIAAFDIIEHVADCDHVSEWVCERCAEDRIARLRERLGRLPRARHQYAQIHVMNEAWRVLVPGGIFDIEVPTTDGRGAWQDPQHRSYWNANSFTYYTVGEGNRERFCKHNGVLAAFDVVGKAETKHPDHVTKLRIQLRAVK